MSNTQPQLILITGIMAAGKSTVAQHLAERLPRSVHLRGDAFRRMIVNGRAEMNFELSAEAQAQLSLRYRIAATVAGLYLDDGWSVVYQDIIIGAALAEVVQQLRDHPLHVVVLCPSAEAVAAREAGRAKTGYGAASVAAFDQVLRTATPRLGLWLDSSHWSVAETVDQIQATLARARV
jgi:predicted kinase